MPPNPKPPGQRQRRNRPSTAATLRAVENPTVPDLPARLVEDEDDELVEVEWHPMTLAWWQDVWKSPMAPEYLEADRHGLYLLAALVDDFWTRPSAPLAAEIRLQRQCFGLTPVDRRRLEWHVEQGEEASERTAKRRKAASKSKARRRKDPRATLTAVS